MNSRFLFGLSILLYFGLVSCENCSSITEPQLDGYSDFQPQIDVLEGDIITLSAVAQEEYTHLWELPNGDTHSGESISIGPMNESLHGRCSLSIESKRCDEGMEFDLNYIDLTPECGLKLDVLKSTGEEELTFDVEDVRRFEDGQMILYAVSLGGEATLDVRFNKVPEPGKYRISGGKWPDFSDDFSLGMFFDFGFLEDYKVPVQESGVFAYIRRDDGKLKMAFCDVRTHNDVDDTWRNMSMEFNME